MQLSRQLALAAAALLALAACRAPGAGSGSTRPAVAATSFNAAAYERALDRWLNRSEVDLVSAWGVPERSQRLTDGGQALQYVRKDPVGNMLCTTLFTSDITGMVRTWTFRGSDCRAPRLGDYGTS